MSRRILAWECVHCGELKKSKKISDRHEVTCLRNPDCVNCYICSHNYIQDSTQKLMCSKKAVVCSRMQASKCTDFVKTKPRLPV